MSAETEGNGPSDGFPDPLVFTDSAALKVKGLIEEEGNPELKLRVFISGGGCSGFQYGFTFDEDINDGDTEVEKEGVKLLIDPKDRSLSFATRMQPQLAGAGLRSRYKLLSTRN